MPVSLLLSFDMWAKKSDKGKFLGVYFKFFHYCFYKFLLVCLRQDHEVSGITEQVNVLPQNSRALLNGKCRY